MPMPAAVRDDAVGRVAAFCESRVPLDLRSELRVEHSIRGARITIVERRAPWSEIVGADWTSTNVAQLRYDERSGLLAEIEEDPTGIFWG